VGYQAGVGGLGGEEMGKEMMEPGLPTVGLSGSGGTGETLLIFAPFLANRAGFERRSRCPLAGVSRRWLDVLPSQMLSRLGRTKPAIPMTATKAAT